MAIQDIRNFCIIAHIDHGKSTLADRILQITNTVSEREFRDQFLDSHSIERERGITIKAKAVRINYKNHTLNLIDTPGHVDFSYEVSRSLAACEGAVLVVDASQGVQAQTVANTYHALEAGLEIIPVINKIDLPTARIKETEQEICNLLGIKEDEIIKISAKLGTNIDLILDSIIKKIPHPKGSQSKPCKALIFDSVYNDFRGVIIYVKMIDGSIHSKQKILFLRQGGKFEVEELGIFKPQMHKTNSLSAGEVGYVITGIKNIHNVKIGDTITTVDSEDVQPLPGYKEPLPMVFCGLYPTGNTDFKMLRRALEKLSLNDSSFVYQEDSSSALGLGFRCGFLGMLHMEILQERLERDENIQVVRTAPNVHYEVVVQTKKNEKEILKITNPAKFPDESKIVEIREPICIVNLIIPAENIGAIMKLCEDRRGIFKKTEFISPTRVILTYEMPFSEIIFDFYDKLKSATHGYGTMDYHITSYRTDELVKLKILIAGIETDALSMIVHKKFAEKKGRKIIQVLRKGIPRHLFEISLQASIGNRVIARENIKPLRKNVIAKCYGGDVTRKRKLLEKQKEGKKKLKSIGQVDVPQEVFLSVLRSEESD